jgi:PTH1 family peptidyl-tRNA hydrolase
VVHDDIDLALGRLRYRDQGSSGGHRGVESIIEALGTVEFARLKVGVGRPDRAGPQAPDAADFVLSAAGPEERGVLDRAFRRAAESLDVWIGEGVDRAATLYNGPEREPGRGS